jgi:hypothetical protein
MAVELKQAIINHFGENVSAVGFAAIDRFNSAFEEIAENEKYHASKILRDSPEMTMFTNFHPGFMYHEFRNF